MVWLAAEGRLLGLNGSGRSAAAASADQLRAEGYEAMPQTGPYTITVPGCVDAWVEVLGRCGTWTLGACLEAAERLAREGFELSAVAAGWITHFAASGLADDGWRALFAPAGRAMAAGSACSSRPWRPRTDGLLKAAARSSTEAILAGSWPRGCRSWAVGSPPPTWRRIGRSGWSRWARATVATAAPSHLEHGAARSVPAEVRSGRVRAFWPQPCRHLHARRRSGRSESRCWASVRQGRRQDSSGRLAQRRRRGPRRRPCPRSAAAVTPGSSPCRPTNVITGDDRPGLGRPRRASPESTRPPGLRCTAAGDRAWRDHPGPRRCISPSARRPSASPSTPARRSSPPRARATRSSCAGWAPRKCSSTTDGLPRRSTSADHAGPPCSTSSATRAARLASVRHASRTIYQIGFSAALVRWWTSTRSRTCPAESR